MLSYPRVVFDPLSSHSRSCFRLSPRVTLRDTLGPRAVPLPPRVATITARPPINYLFPYAKKNKVFNVEVSKFKNKANLFKVEGKHVITTAKKNGIEERNTNVVL